MTTDGPRAVGLNLLWMSDHAGGAGRYARELIAALLLAHPELRLHAFTSRAEPADLRAEPWAGEVTWTQVPVGLGSPPLHVPAQLFGLRAYARGLDLLHGLANVVPAGSARLPTVVTVLDLIWLLHPETVAMAPRLRALWAWQTRRSARRATRVLAISETTKDNVVREFGVDAARVDVTLLGVRAPTAAAPATLPGRVLLSVAQMLPYKNHALTIRALPSLPDDVRLVIVGLRTPHSDELEALAAALGVADRVDIRGYVPDTELESLYARADAVVLPSRVEGFGLPVLEAMARGVPVACARTPALLEAAGDAALTFSPDRAEELAAAVRRLLEDPEPWISAGREQAASLTWKHCADATWAAYLAAWRSARA
jgi:glycosyltransferase involved in cell wall biosynthesis